MSIEHCKIWTPQFKDGKVHHYHSQSGEFDTEKLKFKPYPNMFGFYCGGDHEVQFSSIHQWKNSCKPPKEKRTIKQFIIDIFNGKNS